MRYKHKINEIVLAFLCVLFSSLMSAQTITATFKNTPLKEALKKIEQQTGYSVVYEADILNGSKNLSSSFQNTNLNEVLSKILGSNLSYKVDNKTIIISKKSKLNQPKGLKTVKGTVLDDKGLPVPGASVVVQGTDKGTTTDFDGNYILENVPSNAQIVISYIGFKTRIFPVSDKRLAEVILKEDAQELQEVVVVGYGTQRKGDLSTAVSSVKAEQLANNPSSDFRQSLSGKMAGVQVTTPGGGPEGKVSIRIRGVSTVSAGSDPLYIVDGVPVERGFANLNPNDIESVQVLKDASAAAIYGSRGSNGVILITTKKGKSETLTVQYDSYYGIQNVSKKLSMMNAYEFAEFAKDGHNNAYLKEVKNGKVTDPNNVRPKSYHQIPPDLFPYLEGKEGLTDTDWQDAIFRQAENYAHNLSFSGRTKNVNYFVSGNYLYKEGVIINSDFKKYGLRMNLDAKYGRFKFGVNFAPSYSKSNRVDASGQGGIVQSALMMSPVFPVYNTDGSYNYQGNGYWRIGTDYQHNEVLNPVAMAMLQSDVVDRISMIGKVFGEMELTKDLTYKISLGGDFYGANNNQYRESGLPLKGKNHYDYPSNPEAYSSSSFFYNWLFENQLTYNKTFNDVHRLNAILVQSAQKETVKSNYVKATDFPNDYIKTVDGGVVTKGGSNIVEWSLASYLARVQYSYDGRYLLSGAIRADGSSRFGKNNRWGYFPSSSLAWRISKEDFFRDTESLSFIDDLKIRTSYGITGNFQIGNYAHLATMSLDNYVLGRDSGALVFGYKPDNIDRDNLTWEKNYMINAGIDLQMFKGLLGLTIDYYNTDTTDMLLKVPVVALTGYTTSLMNIGRVNNRGIELGITSRHDFSNDFGYSFNANWAKNINEVKALGPGDAPIIVDGSVGHAYYITEVGKPIGNYFLLVEDGIFKTQEELDNYPHFKNTEVGDFRFIDIDGDGELDLDKDRTVVGNYMPDFTYGFGGSVWYKGIDLNFNFQGVYGNEILNLNRRYIDNMEGNVNGTTIAKDRWRSEANPGNGKVNKANRKQTGYNGRTSTWHIEDGSYLRLQNISLGYTLPKDVTQKFFINKLRVYASGQNLLTFTKYSGYNPEVNARPGSSLTPGEDYGTYPLEKTVMFGVNLTLK